MHNRTVNAVCTLSRRSSYGQLLEQLIFASLSRPTVFLQCYMLSLLYFEQINDDMMMTFQTVAGFNYCIQFDSIGAANCHRDCQVYK